jgi:hypothetical protein
MSKHSSTVTLVGGPLSNVIDSIPQPHQSTFVKIVGEDDPTLLAELRSAESPSKVQKEAVEKILLDKFLAELGPDDEPSELGRLADRALAIFHEQWPNDAES